MQHGGGGGNERKWRDPRRSGSNQAARIADQEGISGRIVRLCLQLFIRYPLSFVPSLILYRNRPFTLNRPQTPCAFVRFGAALLTVLSDRERC